MSDGPDEDKHLATIERLQRRVDELKAENRRIAQELDFRDEKIRVLERVIIRLGNTNNGS